MANDVSAACVIMPHGFLGAKTFLQNKVKWGQNYGGEALY
jgi:hypothetical protein